MSESDIQRQALRDFGWLVVCRVRQRLLLRESPFDWPDRMRVAVAERLSEEAEVVGVDIDAAWDVFQADIEATGAVREQKREAVADE